MGKLFLVPTPIGNLDDITLRAIKVLSSADIVLAEDTRTTQVLLKHLGLDKKLWSHHKFNEHAAVESVARRLPPVRRWRWCRMRGHREFPIPGSCWCAPVSNMASKWKLFPVRRLLSRRWSTAVSPATGSVSKVSCPRKRGVRGGCSNSPMRSGR